MQCPSFFPIFFFFISLLSICISPPRLTYIPFYLKHGAEKRVTMLTSLEINGTLEPQDSWTTELFYSFTSIGAKELVLAEEHK